MRASLTLPLTALNIAACWSLQFVYPPPGQAFKRYSSARSHDHSVANNNAILIQSKMYNVSDRVSNESLPEASQIRRTVVVQKEENSEENYTEPKVPQYAIDCGADKACLEAHGMDPPEATFKPYTQEELESLIKQYAESQGRPPQIDEDSPANKLANLYMDEEDAVINVLESNSKNKDQEKSKSASWHLLQSQKHNHPLDDHKGWVTLEPVPWAQSQIQKWEPNVKPQIPSWDSPNHHNPSSSWGSRPSQDYSTERPWNKPSYEYKPSRPQWGQWTRPTDSPSHWNQDIITDNQPGYFPSSQSGKRPWYDQEPYGSNRPPQTYEDRPLHQNYPGHHSHPSSHPSEGDGQWVLLSSTKGYSVPHRHRGAFQRSLTFDTKAPATASVSSHRTVRLTVLPADNSTNTTLSHGGLLEVERTLQTVEEAQREHAAKMLKLKTLKPEDVTATPSTPTTSTVPPSPVSSARRSSNDPGVQVYSASPVNPQSKTAVLAAIGAGMIPATMAMLLPMVLGRRRRNADSDEEVVNNTRLERVITLQRPSKTYFGRRKPSEEASY